MNQPQLRAFSDAQLVKGFSQGSERCFEELFRRYKSKIFTTILLIVKDREIAEDLFQDVMIKVLRMLRKGKYNEEGKFLPWVSRIARNLAIDYFRRQRRHQMIYEQEGQDLFSAAGNVVEGPDQDIIRQENHRYMRNLIQRLPDRQREVLVMRVYAEMSFKEIASATDVSINTALGRMRYALLNLKKMTAEPAPAHAHDQKIQR